MQNHPTYKAFKKLLLISGHAIDEELSYKLLFSHPSFPSLEAFSETLSFFDIPHEVYSSEYEFLTVSSEAMLLHLRVKKGRFVVLQKADQNEINFYDSEFDKNKTMNKFEFVENWSGIILSIKKVSPQKRKCQLNKLNIIKCVPILFLLISLAIYPFILPFDKRWIFSLIINLIGITVTALIVSHELHINNKIIQKVCQKSKQIDCDAVLSSPVSNFLGLVSLGDIGLVYFTGSFLFCSLLPILVNPQGYLQVMYYLSACTLPYTFYSVYYQIVKVKKWCPFCSLSMFLLWIAFISYFFINEHSFAVTLNTIYFFFLDFGCIAILWIKVKPFLLAREEKKIVEINTLKMKRNPKIISSLLNEQYSFDMSYHNNEIILGNISSDLIITTLISDKCKYCKDLLKTMIHLTEKKDCKFKWIIRFDGINHDSWLKENFQYLANFFYLYRVDKTDSIKVLKNWSDISNYNTWQDAYSTVLIQKEDYSLLIRNFDWVKKNNFTKIPLIFINDKILPSIYNLSDLPILLSNEDTISILQK